MRAMCLERIGPVGPEALAARELPIPVPRAGEVLVRVRVCGVCHTELDEIEGRTAPPRLPVVPGHQVVGDVVARGADAVRHRVGDRVGIAWIHSSDGSPTENLSPSFVATGRDVDGGYAQYATVHEAYAFPIPAVFSDVEAAPLLCAGAVGWRALRLCELEDGAPLGLTGFGASGHLVLQLARRRYPRSPVHVFARSPEARAFATELGADWVGDTGERAPTALAAVIDTTPAWRPVVEALASLAPGGRLVINAIRKQSDDQQELMRLSYHEHLWMERQVRSVANVTAQDVAECLAFAARDPLRPRVTTYALEDANRALLDLAGGRGTGAKVLVVGGEPPPG